MNIEVLLTEAEIAEEFAESIEARDVPEKFFYWTPLSVNAWRAVASRSQERMTETWEALAAKAVDLTRLFGERIPVISFGAGDGAKDRVFLKALRQAGRDVRYFPVDASQMLLETACAGAEDDECEAVGIKADISSPMHVLLAADAAESPRVFFMTGNTLGGFDPFEQLKHVGDCLAKSDLLVVDAQLQTGEAPAATPELKRFVFGPLASAGAILEDGDLEFSEKQDERRDGLHLITRKFHAGRDLTLMAAGREIHVERGERIFLNFRYRFTPEAIRWLLAGHAGLRIVAEMPSSDEQFVTFVCIK
jgi:uncharacterized SAM-dependent methyltransferase